MMMIAGIVVTAIVSGAWLDPFSFARSDHCDGDRRGYRIRRSPALPSSMSSATPCRSMARRRRSGSISAEPGCDLGRS
jgi:hypothetical protein